MSISDYIAVSQTLIWCVFIAIFWRMFEADRFLRELLEEETQWHNTHDHILKHERDYFRRYRDLPSMGKLIFKFWVSRKSYIKPISIYYPDATEVGADPIQLEELN